MVSTNCFRLVLLASILATPVVCTAQETDPLDSITHSFFEESCVVFRNNAAEDESSWFTAFVDGNEVDFAIQRVGHGQCSSWDEALRSLNGEVSGHEIGFGDEWHPWFIWVLGPVELDGEPYHLIRLSCWECGWPSVIDDYLIAIPRGEVGEVMSWTADSLYWTSYHDVLRDTETEHVGSMEAGLGVEAAQAYFAEAARVVALSDLGFQLRSHEPQPSRVVVPVAAAPDGVGLIADGDEMSVEDGMEDVLLRPILSLSSIDRISGRFATGGASSQPTYLARVLVQDCDMVLRADSGLRWSVYLKEPCALRDSTDESPWKP